MKIYKLSSSSLAGEHRGYWYYGTKQEACDVIIQSKGEVSLELETIEVGTSEADIIAALNKHGGHPDNG